MPGFGVILRLLRAVRWRARNNQLRQGLTDAAIRILGLFLLIALWNRLAPLSWVLGWPAFAVVAGTAVGFSAWRLARAEPLWKAARRADQAAELYDELTSAYWFQRHPEDSEWVAKHIDRAEQHAAGLDAQTLVPFERPQRLAWPIVLIAAIGLLSVTPVPRVFEQIVERLSQIQLTGGDKSRDPVAELDEATDRDGDGFEDQPLEELRPLLPQLEEQQQEGENALPDDALGEESEAPEGAQMEGEEGQQEGEPGEDEGQQMEAQNPEDMEADSEGEPSPDPNAREQDGQGDSTEDTGAMLPGGDEVFLQEGGEDLEQVEAGEEELGHATREGGGEEELELGEMTTLEVQLQREILAVPEPEEEEDPEADKEELVTRAERSYLDFESVELPPEFEKQELLESEPIPWRYRPYVLTYFKALRERDNQRREEERR